MPNDVKDDLQKWGVPFWKKLIAVLKPHMVLMSVAKRYRSDLGDYVGTIQSTGCRHEAETKDGDCAF